MSSLNESACTHREGIEYIAARRIRGANRWMMSGVQGLDAWKKFWSDSEMAVIEGERTTNAAAILPDLP